MFNNSGIILIFQSIAPISEMKIMSRAPNFHSYEELFFPMDDNIKIWCIWLTEELSYLVSPLYRYLYSGL